MTARRREGLAEAFDTTARKRTTLANIAKHQSLPKHDRRLRQVSAN